MCRPNDRFSTCAQVDFKNRIEIRKSVGYAVFLNGSRERAAGASLQHEVSASHKSPVWDHFFKLLIKNNAGQNMQHKLNARLRL